MPKKGRKGVEQRVKGNVKAASSGRMADLLGGEMTAGIIGFEAVSRGLEGEGEEEVSHGAGARFQVVVKQLGKRDTTTKIKALNEFSSLCEEESAEAVVSVLNIWTLMYNKLSTDNDNRVREASHRAMQSCVAKIKNSMAPHLRSILGPWLAGMCDPYSSAASAAQTAFSTAFSPEKQTDVLKFGFKAIVTFVEDVALKQTQDTFSDPKVVAADERQQRYERVVTMSLHGLSLALQRLPAQFLQESREDWESFLTEKRLWKLSRHNNPYIRASCYKLVVSLCQCCGHFVPSHARQFCPLVLSSLGEKEPGVVGPLWEAVLLTTSLCQDWSEHVNVPKALLPGLWQLLSEGGHGSARQVYPCLLPLLTRLAQQVYSSDVNFATSFMEKLKRGVQADRVRGSVSESEAVLQTCGQCLCHLLVAVDTCSLSDAERQQFHERLLGTVVELVEYSVTQCPRTQTNVVCGWIGRILDDLLEIGSSHPLIEQHIQGWLQSQLTEILSSLLGQGSDKAHFSKFGSLLRSLGSHYSKPDADRRVTFDKTTAPQLPQPEERSQPPSDTPPQDTREGSHLVEGEGMLLEEANGVETEVKHTKELGEKKRKMSGEVLSGRISFLRPAIAGVCAQCVSSVAKRQSVEHCSLLCLILRMYGSAETAAMVYRDDKVVSLLGESGRSTGGGVAGREGGGEGEGEEMKTGRREGGLRLGEEDGEGCSVTEIVIRLSDCLLRAIDGSVISGRDPRLMEGVVSSILLLLQIEGVSFEAVPVSLHKIVQNHPSVLPLLLTKLGGGEGEGKREWVRVLLHGHQSLLLQLVRERGGGGREEGVRGEDTFLWHFLELSLSSPGCFLDEEQMKRSVLEVISGVLQTSLGQKLQEEGGKGGRRHGAATLKLLQTLASASSEIVEDYFTFRGSDGSALLHCMLHWCLDNCRPDSVDSAPVSAVSLLAAVCQCYSHLVTLLPEPASYLESTANLLSSLLHNDLNRVFAMAVVVHLLHSTALSSYGTFWSLYQPLRPQSPADKTVFFPLGALEACCSKQPYSPLFTDLSSTNVVTSLTGSGLLILFLATALCQGPILRSALQSLEFDSSVGDVASTPANLTIAFPASDSPQERRSHYRLWRTTVCEVMLALCALQPSHSIHKSHGEEEVVNVLRSALEQCLVLGSGDHHQWNAQLLDELIDRASMEGPVWCLVLQQFMTALENSVDEDGRLTVVPDFVSMVLRDVEPGLVLAAVSGVSREGRTEVEGRLMGCVRGRESDICLLCACVHLLPEFRSDLLSLASRALSSLAAQHSSSEITLFESLDESVKDPMVYSLLEVISLLCGDRMVPSDGWEFILCALVTITHLVAEATPTQRDSVNYTVFYCKIMQACNDVALLLSSPSSPEQQASEWREFFSPDICTCLLPAFLNSATQASPGSPLSQCEILQGYHLSCTVAEVCSSAVEEASLEYIVDILFSPLYPFRVTAFLLAKRLVSAVQFTVEGATTNAEKEITKTITIPEIRALLSAAIGRVNLDLLFHEDLPEGGGEDHHTISYLLLCLLLIEIMSHCGPEARASLGEWVKEQSIIPRLLHGLFTVLSPTTSSPLKTQIEVTLRPNVETLCTAVYSAVARHLPSMLRQWYLSVDRWTSSTVTGFTTKYVSPALQQTELEAVGKTVTVHGNLEVRAYTSVSEVSVVYRLHEFSIELFVKLPTNYPLQPPSIREGKRVKVEAGQWRKWMLQLNVFIANQNGTLMDGLLLWKSNLDKHFSGIEDCMICFSVIHGSLYSLPKMTCRTCKKKFHSACLYKWFSTSNKSSCPLCRNIF